MRQQFQEKKVLVETQEVQKGAVAKDGGRGAGRIGVFYLYGIVRCRGGDLGAALQPPTPLPLSMHNEMAGGVAEVPALPIRILLNFFYVKYKKSIQSNPFSLHVEKMTVFLPILCCVVKIRPLSFLVVPVRETLTLTHESAPTGDGFLPIASETVILRVVLLRPRVGIFLDRFVVEVSKSVLDSVHKSGLEGV